MARGSPGPILRVPDRRRALTDYLDLYLSRSQRDNLAGGCPMAASASEIARQGHAISARFSEGFELASGANRARAMARSVECPLGRGTRSIVITAVARSRPSFARSRKVPAGAYTSILGMLLARALDDPGDVLRPRDEHEMPSGQFGHARMHPFRHEALELRIDCAILRRDDIP